MLEIFLVVDKVGAVGIVVVQAAPESGQTLLAIEQMFDHPFPRLRCPDYRRTHEGLLIADLEHEHGAGGKPPEHRFEKRGDLNMTPSLVALEAWQPNLAGSNARVPVVERSVASFHRRVPLPS